MIKPFHLTIAIVCLKSVVGYAQDTVLYKHVDSTQLFLEVYFPDSLHEGRQYPALVFFFGGGWKSGDRTHFMHHAKYFSKRGLVSILADYRTRNANNTTPFEALKDAKSAIRFIRSNASDFHIDETKIIASGGSSGGHLAAATAIIEAYNDEIDDTSIDCKPNALVLFNPVIDNGPGGYGFDRIGEAYKTFSPLHNIHEGAPPTIILIGTEDKHIPVQTVEYYKTVMEKVGSRCELKIYEAQGHGFFNYRNFDLYSKTLIDADAFLVSLGYLTATPIINIE